MILLKSSFRYLRKHYIQSLLAIIGISLGIAICISIDLAITSSQKAFQLSSERISGKATHHLVPIDGENLNEDIYRRLKVDYGIQELAPIIEAYIEAIDPSLTSSDKSTAISKELSKAHTLHLLGIDPLAENKFRDIKFDLQDSKTNLWSGKHNCLLNRKTAKELNIKVGDSFYIREGSRIQTVKLAGYITDSGINYDGLMIMDISQAQDLLNKEGSLSYIDLIVKDSQVKTSKRLISLQDLEKLLAQDTEIIASANKSKSLENITEAFNLNLTALSFLALLVAIFLIYNSVSFSVVQRRKTLGVLRALGVSQKQIIMSIFIEAILFSIVGTALGLVLGIIFGKLVLDLVLQTINDIYFTLELKTYSISYISLLKGAALGFSASIAAALIPAWDAARSSPIQALSRSGFESKSQDRSKIFFLFGLVFIALGFLIIRINFNQDSKGIIESFIALFFVLLGYSFCSLIIIEIFCYLLHPLFKAVFGFTGSFAINSISKQISRTSIAIAALMIAISVSIGLNITIKSFRHTVVNWLDSSLRADIYISSPRLVSNKPGKPLEKQFIDAVLNFTANERKEFISYRNVDANSNYGKFQLASIKTTDFIYSIFKFKSYEKNFWQEFQAGENIVLISEPFATIHKLKLGDSFQIKTKKVDQSFKVGAIFFDYGSEKGIVFMAEPLYHKLFQDYELSSLAFILKDPSRADLLINKIKEQFSKDYSLFIRSNLNLKKESMEIFDRTFKITYALKFIAISVAFIAVLSAFMALQLERIREFAILKASGMDSFKISLALVIQTLTMGLFAAILAIPAGIMQAYIMIFVINQRSFGWSMDFLIEKEFFYEAFIYALLASLIAVIYPAWINSKLKPAEVLRND